jgi:hypothetical protein
MATRLERLNNFSQADPPAGEPVHILCEDHHGAYIVPYPCRYVDGKWLSERNTAISAKVVGWRAGMARRRSRPPTK